MTLVDCSAGRLGSLLWLSLAALAVCGIAPAQEDAIGVGDILTVRVMRHPELSAEQIQVTEQGIISLPVVGELAVVGMTIRQATDEITRRLRVRLLRPEVTISIQHQQAQRVYVLGRVGAPGVHDFRPGMRLTELIAAAGGLTGAEEKVDGTLLRADGTLQPVDLEAAIAGGDSEANVLIRPGDVLNVTRRAVIITITGAVLQPGTYALPIEAGIVEALARAGGVAPRARLSGVVVERADGERASYDLMATILDGAPAPAIRFSHGDIIAVPVETGTVSVFGAVVAPGAFQLSEDRAVRVSDALAEAGGLSLGPREVDAHLFRRSGETIRIDLVAILIQGSAEANLELQDGDMISVLGRSFGVQVLGEVTAPGSYQLPDGSGVLQALAVAGGVTANAALDRVSVRHRDGTADTVDVLQAFLGSGEVRDLVLHEQDVVVVPEETAAVVVLGAVNKPGYFRINQHERPTVTELLGQAGGPTDRARLRAVGVVRGGLDDPQRLSVNIERVIAEGDRAGDLTVQAGDVIFVPERGLDWDLVFRAISSVTLLANWLTD